MLPALYVAQGALQAMDMHSTMQAISRGAHEANPMMQGVVNNKGAMLAVKAGVAASTILMSEKMWRVSPNRNSPVTTPGSLEPYCRLTTWVNSRVLTARP